MYKEYFVSTPLLRAAIPLTYGPCTIYLRGTAGRSFIEGPSPQDVDNAFDFVLSVASCAHVRGLRVHLRGGNDRETRPDEYRAAETINWDDWAFSRIPLESIPLVELSPQESADLQLALTSTFASESRA